MRCLRNSRNRTGLYLKALWASRWAQVVQNLKCLQVLSHTDSRHLRLLLSPWQAARLHLERPQFSHLFPIGKIYFQGKREGEVGIELRM